MIDDRKIKKNIFIGGVARSGKSTIAERLSKNHYNHFPVDYIATSFYKNFPNCGINNSVIIDNGSINLSLFLSTIIEKINKRDEKFVIDSAHVMPKDIIQYLDRDRWDVFFVGYPNILPEVKFNIIREFDGKTSWTRNFNDEDMLKLIKGLIEKSKEIEEQCKEYNIKFIDTSKNFFETIEQTLQNILGRIEDNEIQM